MDAEGESDCVEAAGDSTTLVTPSNGDDQRVGHLVNTPEVRLGALHVDHSDDDASQSECPPTALTTPAANTKAEVQDPKETEKKKAFPKTLFTLDASNDYNTASVPIQNVIMPLSKLISFSNEFFGCRLCRSVTPKKYPIERWGVATSLYYDCSNCNFKTCCHTDLTEDLEKSWMSKGASVKFKDTQVDRVNSSDFQLNNQLYLATQQCGGGRTEAKFFAGMLGLHTNVLKGRWSDIANKLGLKIIELGKELCHENISIEMELSPIDTKTKKRKCSGCGDC
jgi:hypothetical protein